ncbi:NADPH-dependent F420 reductase [Mycobacteroides abscessus]|uniref:NADPH-dependent F420 reductase n=1 Tax=Mycobacteroides abscessus TaxID=36809 RepID=UPI0021037DA8|nr:NAD(P)-binding domain-containing protein [Mycobacteroides abscessus]
MNITTIGKGSIGGGYGRRWDKAGHTVTMLGRDGGSAADADVVFLAVPSSAIATALSKVSGLEGKVIVDATNAFAGRDNSYPSLAHQIKAHTGGPVAKAFNLSYAALLDRIDGERVAPSLLYAADSEASAIADQLIRDAGLHPVSLGDLGAARGLEDMVTNVFIHMPRPVFYRFAIPGEL